MPARRSRSHLPALLAAAMVSLFVVVVGSTPSHASAARVGVASVGLPSAHTVAPEACTTPDDVSAPLELAGLGPDERTDGPLAGTSLDVDLTAAAPSTWSTDAGARGPPTA